jgi:segregation and condensation protein A
VAVKPSTIVYDDTPIHAHMARIHARLLEHGQVAFTTLFQRGMYKSTMIGIFLAVLELVRHHHVHVEQNEVFGEIWLLPNPEHAEALDFSGADNYDRTEGSGSE